MSKKATVFVGLSGGVDSSVAALRLKQQGYNVVGVFIKVWHPDFLVCNWEQERLDAMRVAAKLDIPFLTCDAEQAYKDDVADYFIAEYKAGRTPNPDVMCNKFVKFGASLRFANDHGADFVATGHYARRVDVSDLCQLQRGVDQNKDQTYFLWTLTQSQLKQTLFPVGDTPKQQIRKEAEKAGLLTARKKDSQGICFLGQIDIAEFLSHYVNLESGVILDEAGNVIGSHKGALVYTNGQRHGFTITTNETNRAPYYVVSRDIEANTITVSQQKRELTKTETVRLESVNLIHRKLTVDEEIEVQVRYRQVPVTVRVVAINECSVEIMFLEQSDKPSVGQSCVLYEGEVCLGGGIIAQW